ncbi:MAG: SLATT domain-containing protein [Bifidobacteriaceae bacterium]|nr:SLATT domain-containing protein [Bifidobacteriaceae bacterium]
MTAASQDERLGAVLAELARLEESAKYSAQGQFEAAKTWRVINWLVGITAATCAGTGGVLTFTSGHLQIAAGVLALTGAAFAAAQAVLRPARAASEAHQAGTAYLAIQGDARRARTVERHFGDDAELKRRLDTLAGQVKEANRLAGTIPGFAYRRAKKNIAAGGQTHEAERDD